MKKIAAWIDTQEHYRRTDGYGNYRSRLFRSSTARTRQQGTGKKADGGPMHKERRTKAQMLQPLQGSTREALRHRRHEDEDAPRGNGKDHGCSQRASAAKVDALDQLDPQQDTQTCAHQGDIP